MGGSMSGCDCDGDEQEAFAGEDRCTSGIYGQLVRYIYDRVE